MFNPLKKLLSIPASRLLRLEATRSMGTMPRVAPLLSQVANKVPDLPLPDLPTIGGKSLGGLGLPTGLGLPSLGSGLITDVRSMPAGLGVPDLLSQYLPAPPSLGLSLGGLNFPEIPETSRFDNVAEDVVGLIPLTFD
jgi:hypothetical protein